MVTAVVDHADVASGDPEVAPGRVVISDESVKAALTEMGLGFSILGPDAKYTPQACFVQPSQEARSNGAG